jgi:hypothetical protein
MCLFVNTFLVTDVMEVEKACSIHGSGRFLPCIGQEVIDVFMVYLRELIVRGRTGMGQGRCHEHGLSAQ